jgi:O-acetyl-ADP-ribose deacetylase (regulator of RNase III)
MAYNLPSTYVIHTPGPVWRGGKAGEPELLASCYRRSLELAVTHDCRTVAFPAISCGVYGYPIPQAVEIAAREVKAFLEKNDSLEKVYFVCFGDEIFQEYEKALS